MGILKGYVTAPDLVHHHIHSCQSNILVDATARARITDFGLAMVTQDLGSIRSVSAEGDRSARWIAPEIMDGGTYSKEADIFSFAGVAIEVRCRYQRSRLRNDKASSFEQRLSPGPLHSVISRLMQLDWRSEVASVRHGRPTRL